MLIHVLVALDPESERTRVMRLLRHREVTPHSVSTETEFLEQVSVTDFDLLVIDQALLPEPAEKCLTQPRLTHASSCPRRAGG